MAEKERRSFGGIEQRGGVYRCRYVGPDGQRYEGLEVEGLRRGSGRRRWRWWSDGGRGTRGHQVGLGERL